MEFEAVRVLNPQENSSTLLVCEHASHHIPPHFKQLGMSHDLLKSHIAWDPGAFAVAKYLSQLLAAPLVASSVSRLVYDCNRPPEAVDAIPEKSEIFDIPGNKGLDTKQRNLRITQVYEPFKRCLANTIMQLPDLRTLVTIHSFTPIYKGIQRTLELGLLHSSDSRLVDAMLSHAQQHTTLNVARNQPYGPEHGVMHTLQLHALPHNLFNVMIEIRNDVIATPKQQHSMAHTLASLLGAAIAHLTTPSAPNLV